MIPGAPGTALPHPVMWAFNGATGRWRGKRGPRRGPGVVNQAHGYTVIAAAGTQPYGHSVHGRARLDHLVDTIWTAWHMGEYVASMVRWMCGSSTVHFELAPQPDLPVCPMCCLRASMAMGGQVNIDDSRFEANGCLGRGCSIQVINCSLRGVPILLEAAPHPEGIYQLRDLPGGMPTAFQLTVTQRFGMQGALHRKHDCPGLRALKRR